VPLAIGLAVPAALAGGTIGAFLGGAISGRPSAIVARPAALRGLVASIVAIGVVFGYLGHTTVPAGASATISLTDVRSGPQRTVQMVARIRPASMTRNADWVTVTAWQGRAHLIVNRLQRIGDGVYRTTQPVPVFGKWKAMLRVQRGSTMATVPLYLPNDPAIPAGLVPASAHMTRAFDADHHVLQRERKRDVPGWLWGGAGLTVLAFCLALLGLIGWGLVRLVRADQPEDNRRLDAPAPIVRPRVGVA
jgi:hypothetical protein